MGIRKKYSKEFKLDAVSLVGDQSYSRIEAANKLSIRSDLLGRWVKEHEQDKGQSFRVNGKLTAEQEKLRRLKLQVKRLERERKLILFHPR